MLIDAKNMIEHGYHMKEIIRMIELLKNDPIREIVEMRIKEFQGLSRDDSILFKELCFCILTANYSAEKSIKIQKSVDDGFLTLSEKKLVKKLKRFGYRFPNVRARYIVEARKVINQLSNLADSINGGQFREWLVDNIRGIGYKEASHFLRNIGYIDVSIIDFHIIDLLVKYELITQPKTMSKIKYLKIEQILREIAGKTDLNLAELDLFLWYLETGKILK